MGRRIAIVVGLVVLWTIVVIAGFVAEVHGTAPLASNGDFATIETHLVRRIRTAIDEKKLGSAALVLIERGRIRARHGFGVASTTSGRPVNVDRTLYQVASVSKAVTAWGIMRLVQDGQLKLDEPVIHRLRRWRLPGSDRRRNDVTVRHLLTHTSGLSDGLGYGFLPGEAVPSLEELLVQARVTVVRDPGTQFAYSGSGFAVLQLLMEDVTGRPFADAMKESVLLPLGMTNSSFDLDAITREGRGSDLATSYDQELEPAPHRRHAAKAPVALYASASDLARFACAFVQSNAVLGEATVRQLMTPQPRTSNTWGLGHTLFAPNQDGGFIVGHDGGTYPAWGAMIRMNPATRNGMVLVLSGGRGALNQLPHDWVYWETGQQTDAGRRQRLYDRIPLAAALILLGIIVIVAWQMRVSAANAARRVTPRA